MKTKNILIIFLFFFYFLDNVLAIAPPKKGVKVPAYLQEEFKQIRKEYSSGYYAQEMARRQKVSESFEGAFSSMATGIDTIRIPILLGSYSDSRPLYSKQSLQTQLYDGPNPTGTITDFFWENSYGKMYLTGKISDWNTLPRNTLYYAGTDGRSADGRRDFVIDLLMLADNEFDFSPFVDPNSLDAEGYHVRFLGVIHTGAGAEAGAENIWSHRWNIRQRLLTRKNDPAETIVNKVNVLSNGHYRTNDKYKGKPVIIDGDYACQPELSGSSNISGPIIEIGVFCHEFGHIFGLPDLYDTDNTSEGIGQWCLMASGSWGGDGRSPELPTHMSAWCKIQLGWVTPIVVRNYLPQQKIRNVESFPEVFKLWKEGQSGAQYFLIENRQKVGFDSKLLQSGLLIFHIDDNQTNNNDENRYSVDLEQADGLRHLNLKRNRGDDGDPFPGSSNNRRFDGYTTPNSKDYNNTQTYVGVRNISESGETMTADLDVGLRPYLQVGNVIQLDAGQTSANGRIEPGETGQLKLQIQNIHPTAANSATVQLLGSESGVTIEPTTTSFSLGALSSGEVLTTARLIVDAGFVPREIPLKINLQAENFNETYTVAITLGYPSLLLMDGDSIAQASLAYYRSSLDSLNKYYEVQRVRDSLTLHAALAKRDAIIYFSGIKKHETITNKVLDSLVNYLQRGGRVLLSGQNIAEDLQARSISTLKDVFHVRWSRNQTLGRIVYGIPDDVIGGGILKLSIAGSDGGAANQTSPDIILADEISVPFLTYTSVGSSSIAGVRIEGPRTNSKAVFLGFGIEAINNLSSETKRADFLNKILTWFEQPTSIAKIDDITPLDWKLGWAFPNPFNPITNFQYEVREKSNVQIFLYNLLGQKVATIVSEEKLPGKYNAVINGANLSSGIYFYSMTAGSFQQTKKITLIK